MDINALLKQVQDKGKDQSVAKTGGDFELPAAGLARARLVGYYETGKTEETFKGVKKVQDNVDLVFELSGAKHAPRDTDNGKVPIRMTLKCSLSTSDKSWFYKTFSAMRTDETHMVALLGKPYILEVEHRTVGEGASAKTFANIKRGSVRKPYLDSVNADTGEIEKVLLSVDPALTELKAFVWDFATPEMWDSIFIDGQWDERKDESGKVTSPAKSKNVIQLRIASSLNFKALPCYDYAAGKVKKADVEALAAAVGDVANQADSAPREEDDPTAGVV